MNTSNMVFALAVAWAGFGAAIPTAVKITPPPDITDFFEVNSITAVRDGDTALLYVDREIKYQVPMGFTVVVFERVPGGWRQVCHAPGQIRTYDPANVIPQPVDLAWWTDGACPTLPAGRARIVTTWATTMPGVQPLTYAVEIGAGP